MRPPKNVTGVDFSGVLNRYGISGRIAKPDGTAIPGITVHLLSLQTSTATTDANGLYSFTDLPAGQNYTVSPVIKDFFVFAPASTVFNDLSTDVKANFTGRLPPKIMTLDNSDIAIVLDSVGFVAQPFSIFEPMDFANDSMARVLIFAKNLEQVNSASQVMLTAEDPNHLVYPLPVEFVGNVASQSWLKQLNIRLLPGIGDNKCFKVRLFVDGLQSKPARVCFSPPKSGS